MHKAPAQATEGVRFEFVGLVALMISLVALSIDGMLPALPQIGADLGVADANDTQLVVSVVFLGLAIGQFLTGPMSDSFGRKPVIYGGLLMFLLGCLMSILAGDFATMLVGRFLQGLGVAAPRIVMLAIVRDLHAGRSMARIMSFALGVFILVPAIAPGLGQIVLMFAGWRMIFIGFGLIAIIAFVWFSLRQAETLPPARRVPFSVRQVFGGVRETCRSRAALGYTLAAGIMFGAFIGYLNSAQQIFQDTFGIGELFPLYFSLLSLAIGAASVANSMLVMRLGMRKLSLWALVGLTGASLAFIPLAAGAAGELTLGPFMVWAGLTFFCMGILFGNFNALAMEPLGHIAGVAAATIGSITTLMAVAAGLSIGRMFDGTVLPLTTGFAALGIGAVVVIAVTEGGAGAVWRLMAEPAQRTGSSV